MKAVGSKQAGRTLSSAILVGPTKGLVGREVSLSPKAFMVGVHCVCGVARRSSVSSRMPESCPAIISPIMAKGFLS